MSQVAISTWVRVCALDELVPERGCAALVEGVQIALVRLADNTVRAVSNYDPYGRAHVLSRGIVGSMAFADGSEAPTISSPLHKQVWDLRTGFAVETQGKDARHIATFPVAIDDGQVLVKREV